MSKLETTLGTFVRGILDSHTSEEGVIDIRKVAFALGFDVYSVDLRIADKGKLYPSGVDVEHTTTRCPTILLNNRNSESDNRTVMALLIAEFMLTQRGQQSRILTCDMFFLSDIRQYRVSRQLFLATRLVIPEPIIEKTQDIRFNVPAYCLKANLLPAFVACAYPKRDVSGLLGFIDSLQMAFTIGKKIGNSQAKPEHYLPTPRKSAAPSVADVELAAYASPGFTMAQPGLI